MLDMKSLKKVYMSIANLLLLRFVPLALNSKVININY